MTVKPKQKILVTGASGFLGKTVVKTLLQNIDYKVIAVCHFRKNCNVFPSDVRLVTEAVNLENGKALFSLLFKWKPDVVFHLGAMARLQAGEENPEKAVAVNLLGSMELIDLSARFGVKKFLFVSSDLARDARSVVGINKLLMEYYLQLFPRQNPEAVTFRMPNLYGFPGSVMDIFARQIAENKDLSITDERMARRFITREEAAGYLLYLLKNGMHRHVYSVKQDAIFIKDLAEKMMAASGKNLKLRIIGIRPGEKLYQASYSDKEADSLDFNNLALLKLLPPSPEQIFLRIDQLPVEKPLKAVLRNKFRNLF